MAFHQDDVEDLLVATGRECCICGRPHQVSAHHIVPTGEGGTDDIGNAVPLCPNCHDEVHGSGARGRTTRAYTDSELRKFRDGKIDQVRKRGQWASNSPVWEEDRQLVLLYAQCLDRAAFRTHFHQELSFSEFDRAMEDTVLALNTGYWRTRDGVVIERGKGKIHIVRPEWRAKIDEISETVEEIRRRFREALGLEGMLYELVRFDPVMERHFRADRELGEWMDERRQHAIDLMNSILSEIGHQPLEGLR